MRFDIIGKRSLWLRISTFLVLASILLLVTKGLNFGIDFTGGTILERGLGRSATAAEVTEVLRQTDIDMGSAVIQPLGDGNEVLIRTTELTPEEIREIDQLLGEHFGSSQVRRTELVGPVIGQELLGQALMALFLASLGVLAYVTVRFEFTSGIAALLALFHDVLITLGIFALLGREINTPFVAAMLTVIGYSINDTIVLFDRIRENQLLVRGKHKFANLVNDSIWQTMTRTLNTSLTTLVVVLSLYIFGGTTIRDFTLALIIGLLSGTYSSIFVASPFWVVWRQRQEKQVSAHA